MKHSFRSGFTLIEMLVVIAILGILAALVMTGITSSRDKANDSRIKSDVQQLRTLAEIAYDNQGADYTNWTQDSEIAVNVTTYLEDIDAQYGDPAGAPYVAALRESQVEDFCISVPLKASTGSYYCVDTTGVVQITAAHCPVYSDADPPLRCADAGM